MTITDETRTAEELHRTILELRSHVADLRGLNERQGTRIATLVDQVTDCERVHESDISIIGEEIIQVFNENDFCSIADKALAVLNEKISGKFPLPVRKEDRTVTWDEKILVTVQRSEEFLSISDEDAIEQAKNSDTGASIQDIRQAVTDGEYYLDECQNYEVE